MFYTLLFLVILIALIIAGYFVQRKNDGNTSYARVEKDGGSVIFSKSLMNYGMWLLKPVVHFLIFLRLKPNHITIISMLLAIGAAYPIIKGQFIFAGILFIVSSLFDALDGMVCRELGTCSEAGSILDSTADRVGELFIYFALIYLFRDNAIGMVGAFTTLFGAVIVSYISAKGEIFKMTDLPRGIMRRGERSLYLNLAFIISPVLGYYFSESLSNASFIIFVLWLIGILSIFSSIKRFNWLYQALKK